MSRLSPKDSFVLRFGVLCYGGGLFVLFNVLHVVRLRARGASLSGLPILLLATAIVCPLLGYLFGLFAWHRGRRRFRNE